MDRIVRAAGSPAYIYDAEVMRRQYRRLGKALPKSFRLFYSIKANPNLSVVKVFKKLGAGAEVASAHELMTVLKAGVSRGAIAYAGPGKTDAEIELAVTSRIGAINVESATEFERIVAAAERTREKANVAIRLNLDYYHDDGAGGHVMAGGARKFGVDPDMAEKLAIRAVKEKWVRLVGFHLFPGTGIMNPQILAGSYKALADYALRLAEKHQTRISYLNFGGGLGIPYKDGEPELDIHATTAVLKDTAKELRRSKWFKETMFVMEPGRYLVGPSGVYISSVIDVKTSRGKTYVITDGGIHHALIPIVMNKSFPTALVNRMGEKADTVVRVGGPLCATPDQFSREVMLPAPKIGDLLGIFNSGAYGYSASMLGFLSHTAPAEALVDDGRVYIIRERQAPVMGAKKRLKI